MIITDILKMKLQTLIAGSSQTQLRRISAIPAAIGTAIIAGLLKVASWADANYPEVISAIANIALLSLPIGYAYWLVHSLLKLKRRRYQRLDEEGEGS